LILGKVLIIKNSRLKYVVADRSELWLHVVSSL